MEKLHIPTLARGDCCSSSDRHDRDDPDVPYAHGEQIASAWPRAELMTTAGLGHGMLVRDPNVIRRAVAFLQEGLCR